jgi:hypothetical protein
MGFECLYAINDEGALFCAYKKDPQPCKIEVKKWSYRGIEGICEIRGRRIWLGEIIQCQYAYPLHNQVFCKYNNNFNSCILQLRKKEGKLEGKCEILGRYISFNYSKIYAKYEKGKIKKWEKRL